MLLVYFNCISSEINVYILQCNSDPITISKCGIHVMTSLAFSYIACFLVLHCSCFSELEEKARGQYSMSVLEAESYAAVCHLVTDVEALSTEERSHVLWYACDGGDVSMVKSIIRAGCDVDHFHRGHTPLMMASIRGHDDVVKELILAGCKVDLWSSKCSVGWFGFLTMMASVWPSLATSSMVALLMSLGSCYWLFVLTTALGLVYNDCFKVLRLLRVRARVIAWAGIVPAAALVCISVYIYTFVYGIDIWRAEEGQVLRTAVSVSLKMVVAGLIAVRGVGVILAQLSCVQAITPAIVPAVGLVVALAGIGAWHKEVAEVETLVRTGTVGMAVSAAGTLALALTVAKAGADDFHFLFGAAITMVVTMTGTWGLGLGDALLKQSPVVMTLVIPVIGILAWPLIDFRSRLNSVTGMTALHYAAWYDHITCGSYLVEAGANMQIENRYLRTPLHICSWRFRAAVCYVHSHPLKQVIAVIGNTKYGKSTLIAALQSESRTLLQSIVCTLSQVYNITQRTAGIETVPFFSAKYEKVLFYDFAGQSQYHGPHQPFLETILSKPGVMVTVLLLVKVSEGRDVITQQLRRWLQSLALARTPSTPRVIVVGSFLDQAKSKNLAANVQRLQGCIDSVQDEYPSLKVQRCFLLDCRKPECAGIKGLRSCFQQTQLIQSTSSVLLYNVHWVMAQLQKAFSGPSLQLNAFSVWLRDSAQNLPTHLPSAENVCQDLSAAGYILFLRNKHDLPQSWLVLDLQAILHNVYGTLFSPRQAVVNQFGLLCLTHLSKLFPELDPKMIQEVLITLEFCIRVDPLLYADEVLSLIEMDVMEEWLYFPALVSAKVHEVFKQDQQCLHWAYWILETDENHIIPPHLLQGIILGVAATHVFIEKELPRSVRRHCCSVWVNGLSWGSTTGVDVAVQISDSRVIQVIGRSREGPGELYRYMCSVTQSIFKTIAKLSPALKATPYSIHPYTYRGLDESRPSPPAIRYPVVSIVGSIEAGHKYVHSLPISRGSGSSRVSLQELFGGWSPSLSVVQYLKEAQKDLSELSGKLYAMIPVESHWLRIVFTKRSKCFRSIWWNLTLTSDSHESYICISKCMLHM